MKNMKKALSLILCFVMMLTCGVTAFAGYVTKEQWQTNWSDYDSNIAPAVTMFPGSDESERYIAWYSSSDEGYVELTSNGEAKKISALSAMYSSVRPLEARSPPEIMMPIPSSTFFIADSRVLL